MDAVLAKLDALAKAGLWRSVHVMSAAALSSSSDPPPALRLLRAKALAGLGQLRRAAEEVEELSEGGSSDDETSRLLMQWYHAMTRLSEAATWGERIAAKTVADHWTLGRIHEATGSRKQASRCYLAVLRESELCVEALEALCRVGAAAADVQSFLRKRRGAVPDWIADIIASLARVWTAAAVGQHREAASILGSLAEGAAEPWKTTLQLWQSEQRVLACDDVRPDCPASCDIRPSPSAVYEARGTPQGWVGAARLAGQRGDFTKALQYASRGERDAGSDEYLRERAACCAGHALWCLGRNDEALAAYRRANRQGLEGAVRVLAKLGRYQEALRLAKAEYRARPQQESTLSALADALALHANGKAKCRDVLLRCLKIGGPRPRHVLRIAALDESTRLSVVARAVVGGALSDAALAAAIPPACLAMDASARLAYAVLLLPTSPADSLKELRTAQGLGADGAQVAAEVARAQRALGGAEEPPGRQANNNDEDEEEEERPSLGGGAANAGDAAINPFLA